MGNGDTYLELEELSKRYGRVKAVENVSLTVEKGEFLTLLGPSGSGKTTILRMIAGFATPTSGHIRIDGQPIEEKPPHQRNLGIVFQDYSLFPHMTVAQNVAFGLRMRKMAQDDQHQRLKEVLETVQLTGYGDRRPDQLSGGQRQRVALARAIVIEPLVLLLDEPLGALDRQLREEMQVELRRIHDLLDVTTIFVTHDQDEALSLSDRVAILDEGRLQQVGTPFEVYEQPATPFVASFLGKANLLWLTVVEQQAQGWLAEVNEELRFSIPAGEQMQRGDRVRALVRPERISLHLEGDGPEGSSALCTVTRVVYLGAGAYLLLEGPGAVPLIGYVGAKDLADGKAPAPGQRILVSWDAGAIRIVERAARG